MIDHNTDFAVALIDALAQLGVRHACITPGSRSTPLALALADHERVTDWPHHDERSSAFFALGIARTLRQPVVVVTTSGTAAAEAYPAVVEARYGRVPLIVLTADRPAELRDVGAPQTIDQRELYGRAALWSDDIAVGDVDASPWIGSLAARLVATAGGRPSGPVHVNLRFREPLMPVSGAQPPRRVRAPAVSAGVLEPSEPAVASIVEAAGSRGALIVGPQDSEHAVAAAADFAAAAGWPVIADPLSGMRCGPHARPFVIGHADAMAWEGWLETAEPEVVIRFGAVPTSKPVSQWLTSRPRTPQIFIEPAGWRDTTATSSTIVVADPSVTLSAATQQLTASAPPDWVGRWRAADSAAGSAIDSVLIGTPFPNEPAVARMLSTALADPSVLWVGSSMPIRDVDAFLGVTERRIRILGNRGANGIDGLASAALGSAAVSSDPTVVLAGDLSMLHDLTALATAARLGIPITVIVINNDGGGIFHLLPQEGHRHFERHFGTPHGLAFGALARSIGVDAVTVGTEDDLSAALAERPSGPRLIEVHTDRSENATLHRTLRAAVRDSIRAL